MKRLTTDTPDRNFETMLNFVCGKDGWAHIRHDGENADVPLTQWARKQCLNRGCDEFPAESAEEIDQEICDCMMDCPDCPVALSYCFASQAVHLRDRLKRYEDILFAEDGTELISLEQLRGIVAQLPNPPLTLEELREMDGDPVWIVEPMYPARWALVHRTKQMKREFDIYLIRSDSVQIKAITFLRIGGLAYRRKPEEGDAWQQ